VTLAIRSGMTRQHFPNVSSISDTIHGRRVRKPYLIAEARVEVSVFLLRSVGNARASYDSHDRCLFMLSLD